MKRLELLGEARTPDGSVLRFERRDQTYAIRVGGVELMATRRVHSEERLAEVACVPLRHHPAPRVLIGGLGFGYTLKAALGLLPAAATVVVAEVVAEIIEWNRNPEYPLAAEALDDPRVDARHADVAEVMRDNPAAYDAIMLDVDNGAQALTTAGNARLYQRRGVEEAAGALRPGGRVVYWSADPDRRFATLMRSVGLQVETVQVRARAESRGSHTLLVGRVPG